MALQHGGTAFVQFVLERLHYIRMIVAGVVNAIAGEEVQDAPAVFGKKFAAGATLVADVHVQDVQQGNPLRVNVLLVRTAQGTSRGNLGSLSCHGVMDAPVSNRDAFIAGSAQK